MHAAFADRGLKSEHWTAMESAMRSAMNEHIEKCAALQNSEQRHTAARIWGIVIAWVIEESQKGFMDAAVNSNKQDQLAKPGHSKENRKISMKKLFDKTAS